MGVGAVLSLWSVYVMLPKLNIQKPVRKVFPRNFVLSTSIYFNQIDNYSFPTTSTRRIRRTTSTLKMFFLFNLLINPNQPNGVSHHYQLDESIINFRGIRSNFLFLFHFSMKIKIPNRIASDGTPRLAASHLGLF